MNDKKIIVENALYILGLRDSNVDEATRRYTYRARSPGVKPTTGIKLILPKTSSMGQKIQKVLDGDDPKKLKQMNNLVIGREDDGKEISLEFKTSASREKFRKLMNESVDLDETVKIMFKGFDMEQRVFTAKLKKFGFDKQYRKMMQNFMKHASSGDGFYFIDGGRELGFQVHPVSDMMMGPKIKKLGDKQDLGGGKTATLIAIKEDVQIDEAMAPFPMGGGGKRKPATNIGKDLRNQLQMTKPSEYSFSAPAADGGTFAVIPIKTSRPSSQAGVMMAIFDKRGKVSAYYGTHMDTDSAKKFAKRDGLLEDVQLDETNFRFPQSGEDYGELTKSISGTGPSMSDLKKKSAEIRRKFAAVMRKHKGTKVGEVLDLLDKRGERQVYQDSDIKQISKYLTKHNDNVRKVANQMLTDLMMGDNYLANKRIPVKEDVRLDEEVIKARVAFFGRPSKNNADMRDAKKKNMFADAKDVDRAKGKMFDVTFNSRRQFNRFESEYDFMMVKVFEDVQLDEMLPLITDFEYDRLAEPLSKSEAPKVVKTRKGYQVMVYSRKVRKHIPQGMPHRTKAAAEKDAKMFEDVQLDEEVAARDPQKMVKGLSRKAKQEVADQLNKMNLGGYGDYKATATNVHKFRPKDLMAAMKKVMRLDELRKIPDAFERSRGKKNVFKDSDIKRLSKSVGNEAYGGGFRGDKEDLPGSVKDMVRNIHAYSDDDLIVILLANIPHASGQARMALEGRGHEVKFGARRKSDIKLRKS